MAEAGGGQWELASVAAVQEEITFGGSRTSAFSLEPDAAIVIDVTHATDARDRRQAGRQARVRLGPRRDPRRDAQRELVELILAAAKAEKIPHTVEASGRATGTDADAVHLARGGIPTALVSIPIRYMHSPVEMVQLEDVHATAKLIAAAALRLKRSTSLTA